MIQDSIFHFSDKATGLENEDEQSCSFDELIKIWDQQKHERLLEDYQSDFSFLREGYELIEDHQNDGNSFNSMIPPLKPLLPGFQKEFNPDLIKRSLMTATESYDESVSKCRKQIRHYNREAKKTYECAQDGRKNITKNFGLQLRKYFMMLSGHPPIARNKLIQSFINSSKEGQFCYSKSMFKKLKHDKLARRIAINYFQSQAPILNIVDSNKITDLRWNIRQIKEFRKMMTN